MLHSHELRRNLQNYDAYLWAMLHPTELWCTLLNRAAPSEATLNPTELSYTLQPSELPWTLIARCPAELCCTRWVTLHPPLLSNAAPYWATLHPSELRCTLLSYYVPSGLRCTLMGCNVTCKLRCNFWATLYWTVTKFFNATMPDWSASSKSGTENEKKKLRCLNHSGTGIRRPRPVPESRWEP